MGAKGIWQLQGGGALQSQREGTGDTGWPGPLPGQRFTSLCLIKVFLNSSESSWVTYPVVEFKL